MIEFIIRRLLYMVPLLLVISMVCFVLLDLMPGTFLDQYYFDPQIDREQLEREAQRLGLDRPLIVRYFRWISGVIRGDFGYSFATRRPVWQFLFGPNLERLAWTVRVAALTILFTWLLSIPIGVYSATHQYKLSDHVFTFLAFVGMSIPNFFFGLVLLWLLVVPLNVGAHGLGVTGVVAAEYIGEPWSWGKFVSFLWHVWPAVLVIGTAGMAGLVRFMRGQLLDTLGEQYVLTARAKGLPERRVIWRHAVRNAINPLITSAGMGLLQTLFSGALISAIIFNLPTVSRAYWSALQAQDIPSVMAGLMFFTVLLLVGNLIADLVLAWVDPRIRYY